MSNAAKMTSLLINTLFVLTISFLLREQHFDINLLYVDINYNSYL